MSEPANKIEELKTALIEYILSATDQFQRNGQDYLDKFKNIFADNTLLENMILRYLNFIKSLPDNTFLDLTQAEAIKKLASKIIRSIIPQLEEVITTKDFNIDKSLKVFAGQDALEYVGNDSPILKSRFNMLYSQYFNPKAPGNKLNILSPKEGFAFQEVARVLQQPEVSEVSNSLKIFSQKGLDQDVIEISANIFAGIIAKLAGKDSPFVGQLPKEVIIAAQKKAIELAIICAKQSSPILSVTDVNPAINLGKAFGKAARDALYKQSLLGHLSHDQDFYDIFASNKTVSASLELLSVSAFKVNSNRITHFDTTQKMLIFPKKSDLKKALSLASTPVNHNKR